MITQLKINNTAIIDKQWENWLQHLNVLFLFTDTTGGSVKQLALKVTTLSPLSIRSDHSPTGAEVAPYISGSTLMGCLASAHRLLRSNRDDEFVAFFLSDKVQYPNLYPASFKNERMQNAFSPLSIAFRAPPRPVNALGAFCSCLTMSKMMKMSHMVCVTACLIGFCSPCRIRRRVLLTMKRYGPIIAALQKPGSKRSRICTCGEPLDTFDGFYRWEDDARAAAVPKKRLLTRTGINRKYGTVEEKILYNREVYEEENIFFGIIQADDDVAEALQDFIWDKGSEEDSPLLLTDFARFGTARTRGFGRVEFEMLPIEDTQGDFELFKERLHSFDKALRDYVQRSAPQPCYIALTLHAPTILYDELLRYEGTISGERLAALTGLPADTFKLLYHSASVRRIMGWQELWGLPRVHENALDAGSVFLFAVTQPLDDLLAHALFMLEEQGIGQRRAEGFGRICISDPFHRERNLR